MPQSIREVMTPNPTALPRTESAGAAARAMRDADIGDVIVLDEAGTVCGIVTDRDIVVRAMAEGRDPAEVTLGDICSHDLTTVAPNGTAEEAAALMEAKALRRLPVVEDGRPIGIVTLGDLAIERDPDSVLAAVSAAPPNT